MIQLNKLRWTYIDVMMGLLSYLIADFAMKQEFFFISNFLLYAPNKIVDLIYGTSINQKSIMFVILFLFILGPIIFGVIGYLIDLKILNSKN